MESSKDILVSAGAVKRAEELTQELKEEREVVTLGSVTLVDESTEFYDLADRVFNSDMDNEEIRAAMLVETGWTFIGVLDNKELGKKLMKHLEDEEHIELTKSLDAFFVRDKED